MDAVVAAVSAIGILRALVEVAAAFLVGQGVLHVLAGATRDQNPVYRLFRLLTRPVLTFSHRLLPGASGPAAGGAALALLLVLWVGLAWLRLWLCAGICR